AQVGTGPGGNQKIGQYEYGSGGRPFLDVAQSGSTYTFNTTNLTVNLNHGTSGSTAYSYTGPRNTINGAYSPLNDAHYFGRDYWTPSTNFNQGGQGVRQAAADLGYSTADVIDAFRQVGV
uniref:Achromolysin (Fragments) n=1 Tax=Achromobacter lyticus TaxID=224 RepID=ACLY_ACHLY|nr:RecName: Full=Achromolysin [Achromobacter lyticus]